MKYTVITLGCKVNQFETQAIETMLSERGHSPAQPGEADAVIVNTCAVTAESGRKSRQALRRLMGENPGAVSAVCGCFSQISPEELKELGADVVYGSGDRCRFVDDLETAVAEKKSFYNVDDPFKRLKIESLPAGALEGRTRAYMKIEDGCDNFCSYCIIPYARGRVRSMPIDEAKAEAARLCSEGFKEIVVTGIEISSYGKDLRDGTRLGDVIAAIAHAAPEARIHLGSIEPTVIDEDFCAMLSGCGNICPHFHLSLQNGCDKTLKAMDRKYDSARFYAAVELLRRYFPGCAMTADLITGFPGETDADHAEAMEFIRKCGFSAMHVFPYSIRPGTKAASMPGQLTNKVKSARAREAQKIADEMQRSYLEAQVGKNLSVLFETGHGGFWNGHSANYCEVEAAGESLHGIVKNVKITGVNGKKLIGIII